MKRDPSLASLSRDHHQALVIAQKLRRANSDTAEEIREALLEFWEVHGRAHFRLEEEVLLPTYAAHGDPYHRLVAHVLCDHVVIRHRIDMLARGQAWAPVALHELGIHLAAHVRLEEQELFPLIERAIPKGQLAALAGALAGVESSAGE